MWNIQSSACKETFFLFFFLDITFFTLRIPYHSVSLLVYSLFFLYGLLNIEFAHFCNLLNEIQKIKKRLSLLS